MQVSSYKAKADKITQINVNSKDFQEFLIKIDQKTQIKEDSSLTVQGIKENVTDQFISNCESYLQKYQMLYENFQGLLEIQQQFDLQINRFETITTDIKLKNKNLLQKFEKLQQKQQDLEQKQTILQQLYADSNIDERQVELLLSDSLVIDDNFFKGFEQLDKLNELYKKLDQVSLTQQNSKQGLKESLLKNIQEIKNVALSKILKNLQLNFLTLSSKQLQFYSNILKDSPEYYKQFVQQFVSAQQQKIRNMVQKIIYNLNYQVNQKISLSVNELLKTLINIESDQKTYLKEIFEDKIKQDVLLFDILDQIYIDCFATIEKSIQMKRIFLQLNEIYEIADAQQIIYMQQAQTVSQRDKNQYNQMFVNLKEQCKSSIKKLFQKQTEIFQTAKFNIQIYSSYQIIFGYIEKIQQLCQNYLSKAKNKQYCFYKMQDLIQPLDDLLQAKQNKSSLQSTIFCLNVMQQIVSSLTQLEQVDVIPQKITEYKKYIEQLKQQIQVFNISDLKQISNLNKIESNIQTRYTLLEPEASKLFADNAKNIFLLFLNLSNLQGRTLYLSLQNNSLLLQWQFIQRNYKNNEEVLIKDLYLIHDEQTQKEIKSNIINEFLNFYTILFQELNNYTIKVLEKPITEVQDYLKKMSEQLSIKHTDYISNEEEANQVFKQESLQQLLSFL